MSGDQIRQGSAIHRFGDSAISRIGGLALILYGGISLGLIVALAASLRAGAEPSACMAPQIAELSATER